MLYFHAILSQIQKGSYINLSAGGHGATLVQCMRENKCVCVCASERDTKWRRPCRQQLWGWVEFTLLLPHLHPPTLLCFPHFSVLFFCLMLCLFFSRRLKKRVNTAWRQGFHQRERSKLGWPAYGTAKFIWEKRRWRKCKTSRERCAKAK